VRVFDGRMIGEVVRHFGALLFLAGKRSPLTTEA